MASAHALVNHDEIRKWAEARRAQPACVLRTGGKGDPGMIRLDFPGFSGKGKLAPLSWDEWFDAFDRNNLALLVQDKTAGGQRSNFNKLVSRDSVAASRGRGRSGRQGARKTAGSRKSAPRKTAGSRKSAPRKTAGRKTSGRKRASTRKRAR